MMKAAFGLSLINILALEISNWRKLCKIIIFAEIKKKNQISDLFLLLTENKRKLA